MKWDSNIMHNNGNTGMSICYRQNTILSKVKLGLVRLADCMAHIQTIVNTLLPQEWPRMKNLHAEG